MNLLVLLTMSLFACTSSFATDNAELVKQKVKNSTGMEVLSVELSRSEGLYANVSSLVLKTSDFMAEGNEIVTREAHINLKAPGLVMNCFVVIINKDVDLHQCQIYNQKAVTGLHVIR